jgi:1-acyl-sn-glycerol-3-phosphate acyltransferase
VTLRPQVYVDERPEESFDSLYEWARTHEPGLVFDMARMVFVPLCMLVFRARSMDAQHVPSSGPAIIAPNHFSAMDHFFCGIYLRRRVRFMAKSQLFRGPLRTLLPRLGAFPVQRGKGDERSIETALELLRRGGVVVIYPEGGRSRTGRVGERARRGVGRLALESGAPVVPVAIDSLRARNWKRLEFARVVVRYGEPLRFRHRTAATVAEQQAAADAVLAKVRELYRALEHAPPPELGRGQHPVF